MKQLIGAFGAMMIGLSSLWASPALALTYRDHVGWMGAPPAAMARGHHRAASAKAAAHGWTRRPAAHRARWTRYTRAPRYSVAMRTTHTFKRVWFGNKVVLWPVTTSVPVLRRVGAYRMASWRPRTASRWSRGHRGTWHPGYWATSRAGGPGTWTPEPVYRYNPNGTEPTMEHPAAAAKPARKPKKGANGYQYYYYGKPTGSTTSARPTKHSSAAMAVPHDNIPTVYLYQKGHRQGIHLPQDAPSAEPTRPLANGGAPGGTIRPPGAAGAPPVANPGTTSLIPGGVSNPPVPPPPAPVSP